MAPNQAKPPTTGIHPRQPPGSRGGSPILLLLIAIFLPTGAAGAQPTWVWAKGEGSLQSFETGSSVATDVAGNVYVTGTSVGSSFSRTGFGAEDVFVAKYQADGTLLEAAKAGGFDVDHGRGIAVDAAGFVYVTGSFRGTATFQSAAPSPISKQLTSESRTDIFLAKYDTNLVLQWVTKAGSQPSLENEGTAVAVDQAGGVFITGYFGPREIDFFDQPGTVFAKNLYLVGSGSSPAIFVAKYKNDGTLVWARGVESYGANRGNGVAVDTTGTHVVVTGAFNGSADFGNSVTLTNTYAYSDVFVVAYDGAGVAQWAQQIASLGTEAGNAVVLDSQGAAYVVGQFNGPTDFFGNPATPSSAVSSPLRMSSQLSKGGSETIDVFLAKYDAAGTRQWVQSAGGKQHDYGYGVTRAGSTLLVTGFFELSANFGAQQVTSAGNSDVFVAAYDGGSGAAIWAVAAGGSANDGGRGIAAAQGAAYVTGSFQSKPASFGTHTASSSGGSEDVFTAKLRAGPDLYIQDATSDVGDEPDVVAGAVLWASPDIWVRNNKATETQSSPPRFSDEHNHEDPEYAQTLANTPWLYVKTRNRGSLPVSGTLHVYWADASLGGNWQSQWTEIAPAPASTITNLSPGDIWVVELQWIDIPAPTALHDHFCLLARFVADASTPDPIVGEVINQHVVGNVYNSNNIAWKNVTIQNKLHNKRGASVHSMVDVDNIRTQPADIRIALGSPDLLATRSFFCRGTIELDLGARLFQKWLEGGKVGTGVRAVRGNVVRITSPDAWLGNIRLEPGEQHSIEVKFRLTRRLPARHRSSFIFDLSQQEVATREGGFERASVVGGVRYVVGVARNGAEEHSRE